MPLGAFKLNSLGRFTAPTAVNERITGSGSYFVNNYFGNNATYLGNDSSNRPVFAYGFAAASTYYPTMFLFRINTSDLSITVGTSYTLESLVSYYCDVCSERDGAGFRTTSGFEEYAYVGWGRGSGTTDARIAAFTFNKDALTATIGTNIQAIAAANIYPVGNFSLSYVGNRTVAFCVSGGNNGNFVRQNWATRSSGSTTLTKNSGADNFARGNFGQGGAYHIRGMYPSSVNAWGIGLGTGNNGHGWHVTFSRVNSTASVGVDWAGYTVAGQTPIYNTICQFVQLNNTNRFLSVCYGQFNTTVYHRATAFTVTWNSGATAPTITAGTTVDIGGASPTNGAMYGLHPGKADGEAYFIIRGSSGFEYRKLTVSTNTITVGSANSLSGVSPPSALYSADAGNIVQINSDWYWVVGYRNQNTGEIQFLVVKNPV